MKRENLNKYILFKTVTIYKNLDDFNYKKINYYFYQIIDMKRTPQIEKIRYGRTVYVTYSYIPLKYYKTFNLLTNSSIKLDKVKTSFNGLSNKIKGDLYENYKNY